MKQIFALIVTVLILNPCLAFCQPKAKRAIQRMSKHTTSARAQERAAKEIVNLQKRRAESLAKRQEALELNQLSEQFGLRVQERIVKKNSKESRLHRKELRRKWEQSLLEQGTDFKLKEALTNIVQRHQDDVIAALYDMRKMRRKRGDDANPEYFQLFATIYYKQHLKTLTPHMYEFFGRIAKTHANSLEKEVILRMKDLFAQKSALLTKGLHNAKVDHLRLRYLKNVGKLNDLNFNPDDLIFAYEQKISALDPNFSIRHINANTKIYIGKERIPLIQYDYDLARITELYKQLLNKDGSAQDLTVVFDQKTRNLAIYNKDKQVWLRITPHEYASVNRLHIHLNEVRRLGFTLSDGTRFHDRVLFNVSIPILPKAAKESWGGKTYDLYEKMILTPVYNLDKDPAATVHRGNIF